MAMAEKPNAALMFARLMGDFQNSFQNFDRLHQMHRKNLEAMMELNQLSVEAMQSFARRQTDIMQRTTGLFARASTEMMGARSPTDIAGRQLEIARDAFVMAQAELKALAQMTMAANQDLQRICAERVSDTLKNIVPGKVASPDSKAADEPATEAESPRPRPKTAARTHQKSRDK
jgi:phasin family protein